MDDNIKLGKRQKCRGKGKSIRADSTAYQQGRGGESRQENMKEVGYGETKVILM